MLGYSVPKVVSFGKTQEQSLTLFLDGELLRKFENFYDKGFVLRKPSIELWANLQYFLFKEGSNGVVMGKDGWLFTNEEYLVPNTYQVVLEQHMEKIAEVQKQLSQHNKRLIMVPLPMKLDVYSEYALRPYDRRAQELYGDFLARLKQRQIAAAPIRDAFLEAKHKELLYLQRDTHWTPHGSRLTAQEIARQFPELKGEHRYLSRAVREKPLAGDLMNYIRFSKRFDPELFKPSLIPLYETVRVDQTVDDDQLFGEAEQPIMLVGSSYTKIDDWNFPGFLKESLQNDLLTTAVEARGPFYAMDRFLAGEHLKNDSIKTVIWEFPVRTLLSQETSSKSWRDTMEQFF
jgi:alginate O-acetyltransferase complex protein AlgJ